MIYFLQMMLLIPVMLFVQWFFSTLAITYLLTVYLTRNPSIQPKLQSALRANRIAKSILFPVLDDDYVIKKHKKYLTLSNFLRIVAYLAFASILTILLVGGIASEMDIGTILIFLPGLIIHLMQLWYVIRAVLAVSENTISDRE